MSPHDSSLDPIDDVDEPEITAEDVEKRVDDWLRRLSKTLRQDKRLGRTQ